MPVSRHPSLPLVVGRPPCTTILFAIWAYPTLGVNFFLKISQLLRIPTPSVPARGVGWARSSLQCRCDSPLLSIPGAPHPPRVPARGVGWARSSLQSRCDSPLLSIPGAPHPTCVPARGIARARSSLQSRCDSPHLSIPGAPHPPRVPARGIARARSSLQSRCNSPLLSIPGAPHPPRVPQHRYKRTRSPLHNRCDSPHPRASPHRDGPGGRGDVRRTSSAPPALLHWRPASGRTTLAK